MTQTRIGDVSDTAFWMAHCRAVEAQRADALFHDLLASRLAGDRGREIAASMPTVVQQIVVIRTCIIDEYIRTAIAHGVDTILNLGAGLDTRPYRMDLPEPLLWIEADYPEVIQFKDAKLSSEKPECKLQRHQLDLADVAERRKLFAAVDRRSKKTLVLTEGLISYWATEAVGCLADDLKALPHACHWIVEYFSPALIRYRQRSRTWRKMRNAPFKFSPQDWSRFFEEHGWRSKDIRYLAEEGERLRRPIKLPALLKFTVGIRQMFASEEQRAALRKFQGYAILERKETGLQQRSASHSSAPQT
jgi:methyltransferase (TIGR00027 family)